MGRTPFRPSFNGAFSMASIASSISLPISGSLALACRNDQRALLWHPEDILGQIFFRVFFVGIFIGGQLLRIMPSEGVGNVFQEIRPSATCLYLNGSRFPLSLSAALKSSAVKSRSPFPADTISPSAQQCELCSMAPQKGKYVSSPEARRAMLRDART